MELHFERIGNNRYRLLSRVTFEKTPITGYTARLERTRACRLWPTGTLVCLPGMEWDMASGAIDTPDMAHASLAHDAFCWLIDQGKIPRSCQKVADRYFRATLKRNGCGWFRRWYSYIAVRFFQTVKN